MRKKANTHLRARLARSDIRHQFGALGYFLAVDAGDGVADFQSSLVGRTARHHAGDCHAGSRTVYAGDRRILHRIEHDADRAARNFVLRPGQLVVNLDYGLRGQRKTHTRIGVGLAQNRGIDADHFPVHVDQRPAGVAGVDRGISLNKSLELAAGHDVAPFGRNDSRRHGLRQAERTANGQNPVAHLHAVGIAHLRRRQRAVNVDLDHGQIGFLIGADDLGVMLHAWRIILKPHANAVRLFDHVPVGHDISLGIDDYAGTQ